MKKIFLYLLFPFALSGQNNLSNIEAYMQAQADLYAFNGNVLVAQNGNVVYKKSFGYSDYSTKKKLDNNSIFDCGSIAKEFTALGVLLLKDKGQLSYADTLGKFFPELPYASISIQQLLTHTSGIPDGFEIVAKNFDHNKVATNDDLIRLLAREKPAVLFEPGTDMMYSGTGFNLLASIIEKISGQSYNTYMYERIFKPLGMKHTRVANFRRSIKDIPDYANGFIYVDSLGTYIRANKMDKAWTTFLAGITGEGMIITTTEDLLKWDRALKNHSLLIEMTQQEMLTIQAEKKTFPRVQFGYGIRVGKNDFGNYCFHNGWYPGFLSMLIRYVDVDVTAIVLSNNESHSEFIADALVSLILNNETVMPYVHKESATNIALDKYVGKYMLPLTRPPYMVDFPVEILLKNDELYVHAPGVPDVTLKPESDTKFFFADDTDRQIEFETDTTGTITKIWHIAWGVRKEVKKII